MPLTNTQIKYYDSNVLRLPKDKRETYNAQVDRLIAALMWALLVLTLYSNGYDPPTLEVLTILSSDCDPLR